MNARDRPTTVVSWACALCPTSGWAEDAAAAGDRLEQHINEHHRSA